ncbi:unnamed protein product [Calypogeia fissa]
MDGRSPFQTFILYSYMELCMICNPRTGLWESISLDFCEASEGEELKSLDDIMQQELYDKGLLSSTGAAANDEYFILCNPLTGRYKRLSSPELHAGQPNFYDAEAAEGSTTTSTPVSWKTIADTTVRLAFWRLPFPSSSGTSASFLATQLVFFDSPTSYSTTIQSK